MAKYIEGQHITDFPKAHLVFWTKGNAPTQRVNNLTYNVVLDHLKLLYLLSGKIIASASYYFESPITQQVTDSLMSFFEDGDIRFFFDEDLDSPTEHAEKKFSKSPKALSVYRNKKIILSQAKKIETLGNMLVRRPPLSISNKMVELWTGEILSVNNNSIGVAINKEIRNETKQHEIKNKLIAFANNRDKDFVWEYVNPILLSSGLKNPYFLSMVQKKLSQMYALATANVLGVELDEKFNYDLIDKNSKYDTSLFAVCLEQIGLLKLILLLDNKDLRQLKTTLEFAIFREFYFKMIEDCEFQPDRIKQGIDVFSKIEKAGQNNINRKDFIDKFVEYYNLCNYPKRRFRKRLDEIKQNLDTFNVATAGIISSFESLVNNKPFDDTSKKIISENVDLKLREHGRKAKKIILWYGLFVIFVVIFALIAWGINKNEKDIVLFNTIHVSYVVVGIITLFTLIRSLIDHKKIREAFVFLSSRKEKTRIKVEFESERKIF